MSTIYEKFAHGVQHHVKTISFPDGSYYEMLLIDGYIPAVRNGLTGKVVKFDWSELLLQAINYRGLEDETRGNEGQ